jgi:hypothetical protein
VPSILGRDFGPLLRTPTPPGEIGVGGVLTVAAISTELSDLARTSFALKYSQLSLAFPRSLSHRCAVPFLPFDSISASVACLVVVVVVVVVQLINGYSAVSLTLLYFFLFACPSLHIYV